MAAGGGGVERGPLLGVGGVGVAAVRDQQLHHLLAVVDAALQVKRNKSMKSPIPPD